MARPRDDDVRRAAILATFDCVAESGVDGMSMRAVARATGTSTGTLSYHFGTKRQLLLEAIEYGYWHVPDWFEHRPAVDAMSFTLARYHLSTTKLRTWWSFWLAATSYAQSDTEVADLMARQYRSIIEHWTAALARGQVEGDFRNDFEPSAVAARLTALAHGLAVSQLCDPGQADLVREELDAAIDRLRATDGVVGASKAGSALGT